MAQGLAVRLTDTMNNSFEDKVFHRFPIRIGRNELNDLCVKHPYVSDFHAVIEELTGQLFLRDLGSTNGTKSNDGVRLPSQAPQPLAPLGYRFHVMHFSFTAWGVEVNAAPRSMPRRPMAVTNVLDGKSAAETLAALRRITDRVVERTNALLPRYQAWLTASRDLGKAIREAMADLSEDEKKGFAESVRTRMPELFKVPEGGAALALFSASSFDSESVAVQGLKELASGLVPQRTPPQTPQEMARFLAKLQDALDAFLRTFVPLREGFRKFESEMAVGQRRSIAPTGSTVEYAKTPQELALALLDWTNESHEASSSIEGAFADLMIHQVALMNGVMSGIDSLLAQFSPEAVEAATPAGGFGFNRHKALWAAFQTRYRDVAMDQKQLFKYVFGHRFAQAYDGARSDRPTGP